jgi:hypothetical protein
MMNPKPFVGSNHLTVPVWTIMSVVEVGARRTHERVPVGEDTKAEADARSMRKPRKRDMTVV